MIKVQLRSYETAVEHVYEGKWGHFDRTESTFKMLLASWNFYIVLKGFRSFNAKNLNYSGQRAAKLPTIKLDLMIWPRAILNPGWLVREGPWPDGRLFLETTNFDS